MNKELNVAILGFGVVGGGVAELIEKNASLLEKRIGRRVNVKKILDLRKFEGSPFEDKITPDVEDIINDSEIEIVAECMGGAHPAYEFSKACLESGKSVVTSNKEVVATFGPVLLACARENKVRYIFEAAVGGGIPCLRPFTLSLAVNKILSVDGILNGTTNYILSEMTENGASLDDVLREAQSLGYAEKDPTDDVEGIDAARKIVILSALAYGVMPKVGDVNVTGIKNVTPDIIEAAGKLGCKVKLVAHASRADDKLFLRVEPAFVTKNCLLSSVDGVFNAVSVTSESLDEVMFCGKGAGRYPTAAAVLSDIAEAALRREEYPDVHEIEYNTLECASSRDFFGRWVLIFEGKSEGEIACHFPDAELTLIPSLGFVAALTAPAPRGDVEDAALMQETAGNRCHGIFALR